MKELDSLGVTGLLQGRSIVLLDSRPSFLQMQGGIWKPGIAL
jgi:hypothetical protein